MDSFKDFLFPAIFFFVFAIIVSSIRRKKKEWEYEAKLFQDPSQKPIGEFEIEKYKDQPPKGELTIYGMASLFDGPVSIQVRDQVISQFDVSGGGKSIKMHSSYKNIEGGTRARRHGGSFYFPVSSGVTIRNHDPVIVQTPQHPQLKGVLVWD